MSDYAAGALAYTNDEPWLSAMPAEWRRGWLRAQQATTSLTKLIRRQLTMMGPAPDWWDEEMAA